MRLESNILIRKSAEEAWSFLEDVSNLPKWDRGVAVVRQTPEGPRAIGAEFDTLPYPRYPGDGPEWGRMSYRLTEWDHAGRSATVELTNWRGNARFFKSALWRTQVKPEAEGCRVFCSTEFTLRPRYWFLAPVFYLTRRALGADLEALRRVLEST